SLRVQEIGFFFIKFCLAYEIRVKLVLPHAHQLKNENKMNSRSYKRNTSKIFGALKKKHTK
ncbi:hypothetical protein P4T66_29655, partial [Bacillus mycoides]|nr:hypothetical protein [Bacillus mycoides]